MDYKRLYRRGGAISDEMSQKLGPAKASILSTIWAHRQMQGGRCQATVATLSHCTGMSSRTVQRHLATLEATGYIRRISTGARDPNIIDTTEKTNELFIGCDEYMQECADKAAAHHRGSREDAKSGE